MYMSSICGILCFLPTSSMMYSDLPSATLTKISKRMFLEGEGSSNRFTIGLMFSVTDNLTVGIEYSHAELESDNTGDSSVDELLC